MSSLSFKLGKRYKVTRSDGEEIIFKVISPDLFELEDGTRKNYIEVLGAFIDVVPVQD